MSLFQPYPRFPSPFIKLEEKTPKTGRNWMILKETGRNRKNRKKHEETEEEKNRKKQ